MLRACKLFLCLTVMVVAVVFTTTSQAKESQNSGHKIKALTVSQLAQLPLNRRAEYIRLMRESMVDFEKFQLDFQTGNKEKTAMIDDAFQHLLEAAFGPQAYAQADAQQKCPFKCIYAFDLKTYATVGGQCVDFPLGCDRPNECTLGGKTKGFTCEPMISGLRGSRACVSQSNRVTKACSETMDSLSKNNVATISLVNKQTSEYFGLNLEVGGAVKTVTREMLNPDNADARKKVAELIENLGRFAYDDKAYAQLVGVIDLYKRAGVEFPIGISTETKYLVDSITSKYDGVGNTVGRLFEEYKNVCDARLDKPVVDKIRAKFVAGSDPMKMTADWDKLATSVQKATWKRRATDLVEAEKAGAQLTNRTVLQKEECLYVDQRYNRLIARTQAIESTLPVLGNTEGPKPPPPTAVAPPEEVERPPMSLGCPSSVDREDDKIFLNGARCSVCAAEKAVHNSANPIPYQDNSDKLSSRGESNGDYRVSRKWVSLVSTMAVACGTGRGDTSINPIDMMWYLESFGHCSSDVYDWNTSSDSFLRYDQDETDKKLVADWATQNYWAEKAKGNDEKARPLPDRTFNGEIKTKFGKNDKGDFIRIYGISYEQATAIFCNPANFKAEVDKKGHYMTKIKNINQTGLRAMGAAGSRTEARSRMEAALRNAKVAGGNIKDSGAEDLLMCLKKSVDLAKRVYPENAQTCMTMQPMDRGGLQNMVAQMNRPDGRFPGNFISAGSGCYVGDAIKYAPKGSPQQVAIGFKDPGRDRGTAVREFNRGSTNRFDETYRLFDIDKDGKLSAANRFDNFAGYQVAVQGACTSEGDPLPARSSRTNK